MYTIHLFYAYILYMFTMHVYYAYILYIRVYTNIHVYYTFLISVILPISLPVLGQHWLFLLSQNHHIP